MTKQREVITIYHHFLYKSYIEALDVSVLSPSLERVFSLG